MKRFKAAGIAVAFALLVASLAGCFRSGPVLVDYPTPTSYTVVYHGTTYCPYQYDIHEIDLYTGVPACRRVAFPSISVVPTPGTLDYELAMYRTTYSSWLDSGLWYDSYYAPVGPRYHVAVISRTTYLSNASTFERTYASQIRQNSAKAQWSGGKTGNYKFPTSNANAKTKPLGNAASNTGSWAGTSNSRDRSGPTTSTRTTTTTGGSTGKTGTKR